MRDACLEENSFVRPLFSMLDGCNVCGGSLAKISDPKLAFGVNQIRKIRSMNQQLRIVTIRIANVEGGGVRAWSDDLAGLSLTCPNHEALFAELTIKIAGLLEQQGFHSKIVREIHQFVVEVTPVEGVAP